MTGRSSASCILLLISLMSMIGAECLYGAEPKSNQNNDTASATGLSQQATADVTGTWSGTFQPSHPNATVLPFTMTVVISSDSDGRLVGDASLVSHCLKDHRLRVTVNGSSVVLAGTDADGDNATFSGTLDKTGTLLTLKYIIHGSASACCEVEDGTGNLGKR